MLFANEPQEVHEALVSDLSTSVVPTSIMGATLIAVGLLATTQIAVATYLPVTIAAAVASAVKLALIRHHRALLDRRATTMREMLRFERAHASTTLCMAASVGVLGALLFQASDTNAHLIATALLFAYCSGIVSRLSVRPRIAAGAITTAAVPCLVSAGIVGDMTHLMLALLFLVFLIGGMETVAHAYRNAARHIETRLRMASIARRDPLTGLLNRFGLREAFDALPRSGEVAVHAFDLDGFKAVNDRFGHEGGDKVLREIAERLKALAGRGEIVARVGGDEFVVIQPLHAAADAGTLARRIHDHLATHYAIGEARARVGISLGFASATLAETSLDGLMRDADRASYIVKRDGGGVRPHRRPTEDAAAAI